MEMWTEIVMRWLGSSKGFIGWTGSKNTRIYTWIEAPDGGCDRRQELDGSWCDIGDTTGS